MTRTTLLAPLLLLAACATGPSNPTVESVKVPQVSATQLAYDLRFDAAGGLDAAQARKLEEYLASISVGYGDRIALDDRAPGAARRRDAVQAVVSRFGLLVDETAPVVAGIVASGSVRLVVTRTTASVADCPDWRRSAGGEREFSTMSNFGCAMRGNMAAMIADPNDLVAGKPYRGADGETIAKSVKNYRTRQPTGSATVESTGAAK